LKYHPPTNWIRHYLPDDRYKVAGLWKVVSTQHDSYYHRANCPNMLRQPAGIVIGFNSGLDAREAGYLPDNTCAPDEPSVIYLGGSDVSGRVRTVGSVTVNATRKAVRITLADGSSTVTLPANWKRTKMPPIKFQNISVVGDILQPIKGGQSLTFSFTNIPNMPNMPTVLTAGTMNDTFAKLANSQSGTPQMRQVFQNAQATDVTIGGLQGVRLRNSGLSNVGIGQSGQQSIMLMNGGKFYGVAIPANGSGNAILQSFKPR
jgi:hypothetical protein